MWWLKLVVEFGGCRWLLVKGGYGGGRKLKQESDLLAFARFVLAESCLLVSFSPTQSAATRTLTRVGKSCSGSGLLASLMITSSSPTWMKVVDGGG